MEQVVLALKEASETARLAAAVAAVATGPEARVEVVHIVHVVELRSEQRLGDAEELVAQAVGQLRSRGLRAHGHACLSETEGVAGCLAQHARDWHAELIVMGSRGLGHVGGLFGRSVSHALLSKLDLPVVVVPTGAEVPARGFRRVLVAVRDVTEAEAAARAVRMLTPGVEVLAVHVPRALALHAGTEPDESFLEVYETSDVVLRAVHRRMLHHGIRAFTRHLPRHLNVAEAISGAAHEWDADLVALGSRRLHLWEALIAGSTSQDVIHLSDRPVLILGRPVHEVPADDREAHELTV